MVRFTMRTCTYREVPVIHYALEPSLNCSCDVPTMYVFQVEKHELELVTSACRMSCNVFLHECIGPTRILPLLTNLEPAARQTSVV
jgi:hypothetical protein